MPSPCPLLPPSPPLATPPLVSPSLSHPLPHPQAVPRIQPDLKRINEQLQTIADAGKAAQEQALTADDELKKYSNAYGLFGERMQAAREKAAEARGSVERDNVGALRATELATRLRQRASAVANAQEGRMLAAEATREAARAEMLNKEGSEATQSTQLFDAEADEAMAYMSMFGADAKEADSRLLVSRAPPRYTLLTMMPSGGEAGTLPASPLREMAAHAFPEGVLKEGLLKEAC